MDSLALIANLAEAASRAHTRRAVALRLAEVLVRHASLEELELAFERTGSSSSVAVLAVRPSSSGVVVEESLVERRLPDFEKPSIEKTARASTVRVPVLEDGEPRALVTLVLGGAPDLTEALVAALAQVLAFSVVHCRLVERVADLSRRAHTESADLRRRLEAATGTDEIVARSPNMLEVLERVDLVAAHDTTVLLLGESGTGKELLARRLHAHSKRAAQPFLQVNCGAIPESLVESELFGHEKGAFTGATARHRGLFERASGGTLLLDEVGELPRRAQVKLLRVLQEGTIERVGGERSLRVNVRVIAATHRPLRALVKRGRFRADLYYRLAVFPIEIPPLRERPEDVPLLVHHFLAVLAARLDVALPSLSTRTLGELVEHEWPGNVRELSNVLERSLILSRRGELVLDWPRTREAERGRGRTATTLEEANRSCIEAALTECHGRIYGEEGAARRLGVRPSTLQSKMSKLGVERGRFTRSRRGPTLGGAS